MKLSEPFNYENDYSYSINDQVSFWDEVANKYVHWDKKYESVYSGDPIYPDWFKGGLLNTCYNVLDVQIKDPMKRERVAIIYECSFLKKSIKITYSELYERVCEFSRVLLNLNISKDDIVLIQLPNIVEGVIAMLSCSRIGAAHCISYDSIEVAIIERLNNICPKLLITSNFGVSAEEIIPYTNIIGALTKSNHKPDHIITLNRKHTGPNIPKILNSFDWDEEVLKAKSNPFYEYIPVPSNHPLYIIFTSGTTGLAKPIVRDTGGHMAHIKYIGDIITQEFRNNQPYTYFTSSLMGWISFLSPFYSILAGGNTLVMFEGGAGLPKYILNDFWEIIERHKVDYFKSVPRVMRIIIKSDPNANFVKKYDLSSLKAIWLGSDYIESSTIDYIESKIKVQTYINYGQTEVGLYIMSSINSTCQATFSTLENHLKRYCRPTPSLQPLILSDSGKELGINEPGSLVFKLPMPPGFETTIYNDPEKYLKQFTKFKGYYSTGDLAVKEEHGYHLVVSREDDIIRIGSSSYELTVVEQSVYKHTSVLECVCIAIKYQITTEAPLALIVLNPNTNTSTLTYPLSKTDLENLKNEINSLITNDFGPHLNLKEIIVVKRLPKSKIGKVSRGVLSNIFHNPDYKIPNSIDDLGPVNEIIQEFKKIIV